MTDSSDAGTSLRGKILRPEIARRVLSRYESGHYEDAVLAAFKVIEEKLRNVTRRSDTRVMDLLKETFHPATGTLQDPKAWQTEREGMYNFIRSAFLTFRDRRAHQFVDTDEEEAFDLIVLANRILMIIEVRQALSQVSPPTTQPLPDAYSDPLSLLWLWNSYQHLRTGAFVGEGYERRPILFDADNDGEPELLVPINIEGDVIQVFEWVEGNSQRVGVEKVDRSPTFPPDILFADVDNDAQQEVVCSATWGAYNSALLFYKYRDGRYEILRKDPQNVSDEHLQGDAWFIGAHVADINDDGEVEIVSEPKPFGDIPPQTRYIWKWSEEEGFFQLLHTENMT